LNRSVTIKALGLLLITTSAMSEPVPVNEYFDIHVGETVRSSNATFSLKFIEVKSENRCPIDVTCIWPGFAAVKLAVIAGGRSDETTLYTIGHEELLGKDTVFGSGGGGGSLYTIGHEDLPSDRTIFGSVVHLVKLEPYPRDSAGIEPKKYVATVLLRQLPAISAAELLDVASKPYDKKLAPQGRVVLGALGGNEVVADYICSDLCPDYTVRIIHFEVEPGSRCNAIDGVARDVVVPMGIGAVAKAFCFPRVLIENWDALP
jgi:hypothetical protein